MKKGLYKHYKGNLYKVIDSVKHSETEELMVLYKALYGEEGLWVRPYDMFFENVVVDSKQVARFEYIGEADE